MNIIIALIGVSLIFLYIRLWGLLRLNFWTKQTKEKDVGGDIILTPGSGPIRNGRIFLRNSDGKTMIEIGDNDIKLFSDQDNQILFKSGESEDSLVTPGMVVIAAGNK